MSTPNQMPKKQNKINQQVLGDLIHTLPTSWTRKSISTNEDGKEVVEETKIHHHTLKFPLAQNVSAESVNRLAERWL